MVNVNICDDAQKVTVNGDEELLRRAVSNLISNCVRHNPNGCVIKVTLEKGFGNCSICVSDNGTGFTQETIYNLNSPIGSTELKNHGLGLTIVRQIVKAHGGTAEFRNLLEGGCIVMLCLPVSNFDQ